MRGDCGKSGKIRIAGKGVSENTNILAIPHLRELLGCKVGLSDHDMPLGVSVASVALDTAAIENILPSIVPMRWWYEQGLIDGQ